MSNLDNLIKEHYSETPAFGLEQMVGLIEEVMDENKELLESLSADDAAKIMPIDEAADGRFSFDIPIPSTVPTEAWGDPSSQSRKDIARIFDSITREPSIRARITHVNSFLDPAQAARKAPGGKVNTVLNMMQVIESLQACLNDYNESSAGFVFEGFMAALTGGKQIAGRVGGTLPIEDFVAFSETGDKEVPTSLKLLSPNTTIHGSFTNLVDYLFIRGGAGLPEIKYLIALKDVEGETVTKLALFDFIIGRENFVDVMLQSNNGALIGENAAAMAEHIKNWQNSPEWRVKMAKILETSPGYTKGRGMFYANLSPTGEFDDTAGPAADPEKKRHQYGLATAQGEMTALLNATKRAGSESAHGTGPTFEDWVKNLDLDMSGYSDNKVKKILDQIRTAWDNGAKSVDSSTDLAESFYGFGSFHEREKLLMKEELLSEASKDAGSQWGLSRGNMNNLRTLLRTEYYGELNLSQANISQLSKIYAEKLGEDLMLLLQTTKTFTENIGKYFSVEDRSEAAKANKDAISQGGQIITSLAQDPADKK